MQSSINRYLRESNYEYSILKGKACLLREKGFGKKPNKTNSLTRQEEDILWKYGKLGAKTPESIIATLSWQLTQHFGFAGQARSPLYESRRFLLSTGWSWSIVHSFCRRNN